MQGLGAIQTAPAPRKREPFADTTGQESGHSVGINFTAKTQPSGRLAIEGEAQDMRSSVQAAFQEDR